MSAPRALRRLPAHLRLAALDPRAIPLLRAALAAAPRAGIALVGGTVRDALLGRAAGGRAPFDVDVTVPREALAVARRIADRVGGAFLALDAERGAARVVTAAGRLDVTDWR
ncbi:MAG: hypothetical protein FJZ92_14015, partial [Chloroflexi bacterium]|nr:hypothetical protein [Chloroflexota bacterium]